ncbi:MAG: hypothetical protein PUE13_02425 [Clostridiales bacterium]|nr:hypothetical protein [Clostridiales bacterium]
MKQIGNLAASAASHANCCLEIADGRARVQIEQGDGKITLSCDVWDDEAIQNIVAYINFGAAV